MVLTAVIYVGIEPLGRFASPFNRAAPHRAMGVRVKNLLVMP
jgi:hypothetical protein